MKLALVPLNPTIGALESNARRICAAARDAVDRGADLVAFPELALTGYPPRDLLTQSAFLDDVRDAVGALCADLPARATCVIGCPWRDPDDARLPTNALVAIRDGRLIARHDKRLLPTYDVFDEQRYFRPGSGAAVIDVAGVRVGLTVCEDLWKAEDAMLSGRYDGADDPIRDVVQGGARLVLNASASPFVLGKNERQRNLLRTHAARHGVCVAEINQLGANDDLIFDGRAVVFAPDEGGGARLVAAGDPFSDSTLLVDLRPEGWSRGPDAPDPMLRIPDVERMLRALILGVRDYCGKLGFERVLVGLSGGIDSAVTACIAASALGPRAVRCVGLPGPHSSEGSISDARALADALGCDFSTFSITEHYELLGRRLRESFAEMGLPLESGVTEENLQSRLRGLVMMAFSNKSGALLLTTGNKSELAVGYCTLYGDMNGGLAVLSDVTKQRVYEAARYINDHAARLGLPARPIPESTLSKPPSAELRPDQTDQDTLPPYEVLDEIVVRYVERFQSVAFIAEETGFDPAEVARIVRLIDMNEYKRKQLPIGLKVSPVAFGRGRRRAIVQAYEPGGRVAAPART